MQTRGKILVLALLAASPSVFAQQIPGAGSQLRQLPPTPVPEDRQPTIRIEQGTPAPGSAAAGASVRVDALRFTGAQVFAENELLAIARFTPGAQLTLADLEAIAARVTAHYRRHGYFVARAYLPAQDISSHVVTLAVSEGRYGKVELRNHSRLSDRRADAILAGMKSGDVITIEPLEHRLLLLSDVPGVKVSSTLVPGVLPGSSDLLVDIAPGRRISGQVDADNAGNPYTGEYRLGATVNFNNPFGLGDLASIRVISSGSGLTYGRVAYQLPVGPATVGVAYSRLDYALGRQFAALGAHGTAEVASVFGSVPLLRSRRSSLYFGLGYDDRALDDRFDLVGAADRRAHVRSASASLYGNRTDDIGGGGTSAFYLAVSSGTLDIRTPASLLADAATARSNGAYRKLWFNASRLQRVTDTLSLYGAFTGQLASKNLDPSEKFVLGGMDGVRAYPQGEGFGDEGYLVDLEARLRLARLSARAGGVVQLVGFVDAGHVTIDKDPWYAGDNTRDLSAAGLGVTWTRPGDFAVRTYYAVKLGSEDAQSAPDRAGRFWIQAIKYF